LAQPVTAGPEQKQAGAVRHGVAPRLRGVVLRLLETFCFDDLHAAVKKALQLGAVGFDAVKHLVLCQVERRPPKLDLDVYPYLPRANVATTSVASYMGSDAGECRILR